MEQPPLQQIVERLKQVNTVLVTVNKNPTLDQLAACIGLTLFINKLDKHAAAVFSGVVPSTLDFLEPGKTLEQNTDSLRDFIISLDKEKADKLRYKVEDEVVKIFITPYKTSLSQGDFEFTQGDFNVEAVIALGVTNRDELDQAITSHGRILHDATVIGISAGEIVSEVGTLNWHEGGASSLSELAARLCAQLDSHGFDSQIATSLMTGIVAETDRFRNSKTNPQVMQMGAQLMAAGANQQLIADKLEEPIAEVSDVPAFDADENNEKAQDLQISEQDDLVVNEDGSLAIHHDFKPEKTPEDAAEIPSEQPEAEVPEEQPAEPTQPEESPAEPANEEVNHDRIEEAPPSEGKLTASTKPEHEHEEPSTDGMSIKPSSKVPLMSRGKRIEPPAAEEPNPDEVPKGQVVGSLTEPSAPEQAEVQETPPAVLPEPVAEAEPNPKPEPKSDDTLAQIEQLIGSTHAAVGNEPVVAQDETAARDEVTKVANEIPSAITPPAAFNALPALENLNSKPVETSTEQPVVQDPNAPPPVPPPMTPQFFDNNGSVHNPYLNKQ